MATDIGTAATVTFGTSGYAAEITNISVSFSRESVTVSHMGTTTHHATQPTDLYSSTISLETNFLMSTKPPINGANEAITIVIPNGAGTNTWAGNGHLTGFDFNAPNEDVMTASLEITCNGDWTIT